MFLCLTIHKIRHLNCQGHEIFHQEKLLKDMILYEVTHYDPDTGKWRQKTKYLGKM